MLMTIEIEELWLKLRRVTSLYFNFSVIFINCFKKSTLLFGPNRTSECFSCLSTFFVIFEIEVMVKSKLHNSVSSVVEI